MTDDEIIAVVSAHKEGRKIQVRPTIHPLYWATTSPIPIWNFSDYEYRIAPEPRKPREWDVHVGNNGELITDEPNCWHDRPIRVREVIEPDRDTEIWWAEIPLDGSAGQIFTDSRQLTKGGKLIRVMQVPE